MSDPVMDCRTRFWVSRDFCLIFASVTWFVPTTLEVSEKGLIAPAAIVCPWINRVLIALVSIWKDLIESSKKFWFFRALVAMDSALRDSLAKLVVTRLSGAIFDRVMISSPRTRELRVPVRINSSVIAWERICEERICLSPRSALLSS